MARRARGFEGFRAYSPSRRATPRRFQPPAGERGQQPHPSHARATPALAARRTRRTAALGLGRSKSRSQPQARKGEASFSRGPSACFVAFGTLSSGPRSGSPPPCVTPSDDLGNETVVRSSSLTCASRRARLSISWANSTRATCAGGCVAGYDRGASRSLPVRGKGEAHLKMVVLCLWSVSPFRPVIADSGLW
jgi:hypothetical protein